MKMMQKVYVYIFTESSYIDFKLTWLLNQVIFKLLPKAAFESNS